jgi:hypothetical protein
MVENVAQQQQHGAKPTLREDVRRHENHAADALRRLQTGLHSSNRLGKAHAGSEIAPARQVRHRWNGLPTIRSRGEQQERLGTCCHGPMKTALSMPFWSIRRRQREMAYSGVYGFGCSLKSFCKDEGTQLQAEKTLRQTFPSARFTENVPYSPLLLTGSGRDVRPADSGKSEPASVK